MIVVKATFCSWLTLKENSELQKHILLADSVMCSIAPAGLYLFSSNQFLHHFDGLAQLLELVAA